MARIVLACLLTAIITVVVGCHSVDGGASQLIPNSVKDVSADTGIVDAAESDLIEQMAINRLAYMQYLESLIAHYEKVGDSMKLQWAKNERKKLEDVPKYNYVIEAQVAGPDLRATNSIPLADYIYRDIVNMEKKAGMLILVKHEDNLRKAFRKYNEFIKTYPSSDKIDDAAYRAAGICEYFKDYTIALVYYTRAYQWNPSEPNPAMFKAACILDEQLARRDEALKLYQESLAKGGLSEEYKEFAEMRVAELTKSGEVLKEK